MLRLYLRSIGHFTEWLFGAPFRNLPPAFGDTLPSGLRAFKTEVDEIQRHAVGKVSSPKGHRRKRTKPRR